MALHHTLMLTKSQELVHFVKLTPPQRGRIPKTPQTSFSRSFAREARENFFDHLTPIRSKKPVPKKTSEKGMKKKKSKKKKIYDRLAGLSVSTDFCTEKKKYFFFFEYFFFWKSTLLLGKVLFRTVNN